MRIDGTPPTEIDGMTDVLGLQEALRRLRLSMRTKDYQ
jgi:hypothetical protein